MAVSDSSYFRLSLPPKKEKTRICRSGSENVTNEEESGERVIQVGTDLDLIYTISVYDLGDWNLGIYLFELIQISLALVRPEARYVLW